MRIRPLVLAGWMAVFSLSAGWAHGEEGGYDSCAHGGKQNFSLTPGSDLIGENHYAKARKSDSLHDISCRYNIGVEEMFMANDPLGIDHWSPGEGTRVMIPQRFILPDSPRAGITVNIPEMRLYFYPVQYGAAKKAPAKPKPKTDATGKPVAAAAPAPAASDLGEPVSKAAEVITYPVSMGRMDWRTPLGRAKVVSKVKDPTWTPPETIRREHAAKGDILPAVVPAGPDNPLGRFAMRLSVPGYLIHGTEANYKSFGIGMRVTHGCMRMYNEDVAQLFPKVPVGTPVYLVNQPVKLGWENGTLYMEVSQPLDEDVGIPPEKEEEDMTRAELAREEAKTPEQRKEEERRKDAKRAAYLQRVATNLIDKEVAKRPASVDREAVRKAVEERTGMVVEIGHASSGLEASPGSSEPDYSLPRLANPKPAAPPRPSADDTQGYTPPPIPPRPAGQTATYPYGAPSRPAPRSSEPVDPYSSPYGQEKESESSAEPYYSAPERPAAGPSTRRPAAAPRPMAPAEPEPGIYEPESPAPSSSESESRSPF
jgi:L,D-transpeptidase ErfK/SrfK